MHDPMCVAWDVPVGSTPRPLGVWRGPHRQAWPSGPQIASAYGTGRMPAMLPALGAGGPK